ncbi:MAG: hypothetical protein ABFQ62_04480 [Patescibacteria group bacterium]
MLTLLAADFDIRTAGQGVDLPGSTNITDTDAGFSVFIGQILTALFAIVGLILLIYLLWGAIDWITSGGDSGKVSNARNKMTQAVIGLIVFASVFAIIMLVQSAFDLELINLKSSTKTTPTRMGGPRPILP